jgi:HEAT repeat protein
LLNALRHSNGHVRVAAVEALGRLRAAAALEPVRVLLNDPVWEVRREAAEALGRFGDPRAVDSLAGALNDGDADVREATAVALGSLGDRQGIGPLVLALKDSTSGVRRIAAAALSRIDTTWISSPEAQQAAEQLKTALQDEDPGVRHFVGQLLVGMGAMQPETAPLPETESSLASSPAKRCKLAVSLFLAILCDADRDLRQAAAEALGRLGDERARSPLLRMQADPDAGVRTAAQLALETLAQA